MNKDKDVIIISDNHFTEDQQRLVSKFLSTIIPPHEDGSMPGAGEVDILGYSRERGIDLVPVLEQALEKLAEGAHDGLARAVTPPHMRSDGDAFVGAATGLVEAHIDDVRLMAVAAVEQAVRESVGSIGE